MAQFTAFQNILPDPNNRISYSGSASSSDTGAALGPGLASTQLISKQPVVQNRTNSGRVVARALAGHTREIIVNYNDLTKAEFMPIYSFLIRIVPFSRAFFSSGFSDFFIFSLHSLAFLLRSLIQSLFSSGGLPSKI